jgi:hypothetical protein
MDMEERVNKLETRIDYIYQSLHRIELHLAELALVDLRESVKETKEQIGQLLGFVCSSKHEHALYWRAIGALWAVFIAFAGAAAVFAHAVWQTIAAG